jgi:diaminobutyrate-2-oxoglutarate transaminase
MVTEPPGPKARGLLEAQERLESSAFKYPRSIPLALAEGRGATLKDVDGNIYIDFFAGIGVLNVGYSTPPVLEAARKQEEKLIHTLDFPTAPRIKLMERLNEIAPGRLKGSAKMLFGGPTGGDAIEGAIKLAKYNTERRPLIAFVGSYHGQTTAALSVTSGKSFKQDYLPLLADVHFLPYPYPYRPPLGSDPASCGVRCVEYLDDILKDPYSGVPEPAAIIVEPIQGEGGIIVPPDDFLPELARLAKDHSIPLIIDEIQTGFGRTGKMFACEHWDVTPDIMPLAKAVGGIGYPLSGCLYHQDLDTWGPGAHIGTFRGHAVAMAAGKAAIDFIQEHKLTEHAAKLGEYIKGRLEELQGETECIGDVRGKGLFIGIEFIKDRKTKEPYQEIVKEIQRRCFQKGLLIWTAGHYGNVVRFIPPLVITEELVQRGLNIFAQVVCEVTKLT